MRGFQGMVNAKSEHILQQQHIIIHHYSIRQRSLHHGGLQRPSGTNN